MNAGATINSKSPCHLYFSRLAGGEKICRISPEGLPFTSCLKFRRESTLSPVMPERFYQASTLLNTYGPLIEPFRGDDLFFCHA